MLYGWIVLAIIVVMIVRQVILQAADAILTPFVARRAAQAAENARLAHDADEQNDAWLSGDLRGVFGRFPI